MVTCCYLYRVPQDSVLGPRFFFLLYVNDIQDDVALYKQVDSVSDCEQLQAGLKQYPSMGSFSVGSNALLM